MNGNEIQISLDPARECGKRHSAFVQNIFAGSYSDTSSKDNHRPDTGRHQAAAPTIRSGSHGPGALGTSLHRGSAPETAPSRFLVEAHTPLRLERDDMCSDLVWILENRWCV